MNNLDLKPIERVTNITRDDFIQNYFIPQKPVVIERLTEDWPAWEKWHLNYIREIAGDKMVPIFDGRPITHEQKVNEPHLHMKMSEYLDIMEKGPSPYRIFLYNIMKEVPQLKEDFRWPDIGLNLVKQLPMLFFGGENSKVFMHFDIDYSDILHFHFHGRKQCIIFDPEQTKYLYKIPHALISHQAIDFDNPDFEKFPALKYAQGYICDLNHGEMLYMPEGYWHYMKYVTPSFSMSLRALPKKPKYLALAAYNVFIQRYFDNFMRKTKGKAWMDEKNERAISETHKNLGLEV